MKKIPQILILFRFLLGPIMIFLTYKFHNTIRFELVFLLFLGILSDIFDGIIARNVGVSSEKLRRMDSQTDMVFWLCVSWCAWILHPEIIKMDQVSIAIVFVLEMSTYVLSFIKFRKETCTHALLSKLWGISLVICFSTIIGFGYAGIAFQSAFLIGIIAHIDVLLIILILPKWMHDIPSCYHAFRIRKGLPIKRHIFFNG